MLPPRCEHPEHPAEKHRGAAAFSWLLYGFSNTIFSVAVLSFFPLWVEEWGLLSGAGQLGPGLLRAARRPLTAREAGRLLRAPIGSLVVSMAAGLFFLLWVPDASAQPNVDEFAPETAPTLDSPAP